MANEGLKSSVPRLAVVVGSVAGVHSDVMHVPNGRRKMSASAATSTAELSAATVCCGFLVETCVITVPPHLRSRSLQRHRRPSRDV